MMQYNFFPKNRKGWVKVLEVFVSILLVMSVIIFLLNKGYKTEELSEKISTMEISILRYVQFNETLRTTIIDADIPSEWSDFDSDDLMEIKNVINNKKLPNMDCVARICALNDNCPYETETDKNIYSESAVISADKNTYSPRQLKLFCWEK